jgi:hypothetical protein
MSTWVKVARYHLLGWLFYTWVPWGVLAVNFALYFAGAAAHHPHTPVPVANIVVIYLVFILLGALAIFLSLPFAFALGASRRSYYAGTALLAVGLAAVDGLALSVLQVIERLSGGWGVQLSFFRVGYILAGPWYLTWLTSFVGLTLMFVYGMWFGLVYRRWNLLGLFAFTSAQAIVLGAGAIAVADDHAWAAIGRFFTTLGAAGLTGVLAALAVVLLAGGYETMRRVTV